MYHRKSRKKFQTISRRYGKKRPGKKIRKYGLSRGGIRL